MVRWAIFDVDGTLLPRDSMEMYFLVDIMRSGSLPFQNIFYYCLTAIVGTLQGDWVESFKNNKIYLRDVPARSLQKYAYDFFRRSIAPALSSTGLEKIKAYQREGYKIMVMSGSPDFLTRHLDNICYPDCLVSTVLEVKDNRYTGKVLGLHPYGERKREILLKLRDELKIDLDRSVVFANHHSDSCHMKLFGQAVAVNPTSRMKDIAHQHGWMIERWT
jgi:HAD superfamily phosphoserine phosphatase-like hydrolase